MKTNLIIAILLCWFSATALGQQKITWKTLSDVSFADEYFPEEDTYFLTPTFGASLHKLQNVEIIIKGYILNIDPSSRVYLVSENPMASCFFCGMGGPETIMEVRFTKKLSFKTDDIVTITGTFKLNGDDINHCNYILENATGRLENN